MNSRAIVAFILGASLICPPALLAQGYGGYVPKKKKPSYDRPSKKSRRDNGKKRKKRRSSRDNDAPAVPKAGTDRKSINDYIMRRHKALLKQQRMQQSFGRNMGKAWAGFWKKIHDERMNFEVRMGKEWLGHVEHIKSINEEFHRSARAEFERTQTRRIEQFESTQQSKIRDYVDMLIKDVKIFANEQSQWRADFMDEAFDAWGLRR